MRRIRFDMVKSGYVFEHKGGQYIKLQQPVKLTGKLSWNAITENGALFNFYPYVEVTELGSFVKPRLVEKK